MPAAVASSASAPSPARAYITPSARVEVNDHQVVDDYIHVLRRAVWMYNVLFYRYNRIDRLGQQVNRSRNNYHVVWGLVGMGVLPWVAGLYQIMSRQKFDQVWEKHLKVIKEFRQFRDSLKQVIEQYQLNIYGRDFHTNLPGVTDPDVINKMTPEQREQNSFDLDFKEMQNQNTIRDLKEFAVLIKGAVGRDFTKEEKEKLHEMSHLFENVQKWQFSDEDKEHFNTLHHILKNIEDRDVTPEQRQHIRAMSDLLVDSFGRKRTPKQKSRIRDLENMLDNMSKADDWMYSLVEVGNTVKLQNDELTARLNRLRSQGAADYMRHWSRIMLGSLALGPVGVLMAVPFAPVMAACTLGLRRRSLKFQTRLMNHHLGNERVYKDFTNVRERRYTNAVSARQNLERSETLSTLGEDQTKDFPNSMSHLMSHWTNSRAYKQLFKNFIGTESDLRYVKGFAPTNNKWRNRLNPFWKPNVPIAKPLRDYSNSR
ncbi:hypothetical protein SAMN05444392_101609 [Seinonella peptonophila]|uniref:Uncharacterized protein n=1 Tax=Seinonella peptonophila TaxID=112248 RepID=A0A1M4TS23_9BACL|nr:hypothetical protein [Seinonella peptonophila]SHE47218.1 hypothetical protein SAMN05444392_101609 [Seinonella peptonophila]